jgi:predicted membrane protein DUF2142
VALEADAVTAANRARRRWWVMFALLASLGALWALATPLFASADEPSHAVRAWSLVHGDILGDTFGSADRPPNPFASFVPNLPDYGLSVTSPTAYRNYGNVSCVAFSPNKPADCVALGRGDGTARTLTYTGRYFPAYYVVVGAPTLVTPPGAFQIYLMRVAGVLLCAALLASAVTAAHERGGLAAAGVVVAITPMALFFAASINPSGLEVAAGIAVWASGALLVANAREGRVEGRAIDRFGIAAIALATTRPLSPVWLAVAVAVLALVAGRAGLRALWQSARCRTWGAIVIGATAIHLAWNVYAEAYDSRHYVGHPVELPGAAILRTSFGKSDELLRQMVGVFGWLDTPAPNATFLIWLLAVGALVGLAVVFASRRWLVAMLAAFAATAVLPPLLEASQARDVGFQWQGRYTLPLAVGIPVLAAFSVPAGAPLVRRRIGIGLTVALSLASWLAYAQALRRYAVGANGTLLFFKGAAWTPPIASVVLLVAYLAAAGGFIWYSSVATPSMRTAGAA